MNTLLNNIGHQVRFYREASKMTVRELAIRSNLSQAMISGIENGNKACSLKTLQTLSTVLKIPMTEFFSVVASDQRLPIELVDTVKREEVQLLLFRLRELDSDKIKHLIRYIDEFMSD